MSIAYHERKYDLQYIGDTYLTLEDSFLEYSVPSLTIILAIIS
jgi:hypothetical protein